MPFQYLTPNMLAPRAREIAQNFNLRELPADFYANPYPVYDWLREHEPIRRMPDGSLFLTRHADLVSVYKDAATFSSDKQAEFTPKYGQGSPLHEHHTTSLVFNDPPLHTRVRKSSWARYLAARLRIWNLACTCSCKACSTRLSKKAVAI
jgi:cytochrome P450